jgi:hypothetical protein
MKNLYVWVMKSAGKGYFWADRFDSRTPAAHVSVHRTSSKADRHKHSQQKLSPVDFIKFWRF